MKFRHPPIPVVVVAGLLLSCAFYFLALAWEEKAVNSDFERRAHNHAAGLQAKIDLHIELLDSVGGLFDSFTYVERQNFRNFVSPLLGRFTEIQGYSWNPLIKSSERTNIEDIARNQGFNGFQITELSQDGNKTIAEQRDEYVPVFYLEPLTGNEQALGFDISSETIRQQALIEARGSGYAATTNWVRLVQEKEDQFGILVVRPVYSKAVLYKTTETRSNALVGYVVGVFRIGDMIEEALRPKVPVGLDFWVFASAEPSYPVTGYFHPSRTRASEIDRRGFREFAKPQGETLNLKLQLPGKEWSIIYAAAPSLIADQSHYEAVGSLLVGILLTGFISIYLFIVKRDTQLTSSLNQKLTHKIMEQEKSETALRESESYNRMLFEKSTIGLVLSDTDGNLKDINAAFASILGRTVEETKSLNYWEITPDESSEIEKVEFDKLAPSSHFGPYEKSYFRKDGSLVSVRQTGRAILRQGAKYIWSSVEDVTDFKSAREHIEHMAFHDRLTNLPNRELLNDRLEHAIELSSRSNTLVGVMFLDIDRFKTINDSLGHKVGDELLVQVAERLNHAVRHSDTVARFGGDEFIVVVERIKHHDELEDLAKSIIDKLSDPFQVGVHRLFTTISIGIAVSTASNCHAEELITQADIAMYSAKDAGRNTYCFHAPEMAKQAAEMASIERDLHDAMEREELLVYLQPITGVSSELPLGFEALMRWQHAKRGLVSPNDFIPVMESSGMIVPASRWMIEQSCRIIKRLNTERQQNLSIAVNLSAHCFRDSSIVDHIMNTLSKLELEPNSLIVEITESTLFSDPVSVRPVMQRLKDKGVRIALDDFGTGQSSLNHLRSFPIDIVKIDKEFIHNIPQDTNDCELVSAIIAMAHNLQMRVVAEGVEKPAQLEFLRDLHCDSIQGYLYCPPRSIEEIETYINQPLKFGAL